jgi:hypothetical protein
MKSVQLFLCSLGLALLFLGTTTEWQRRLPDFLRLPGEAQAHRRVQTGSTASTPPGPSAPTPAIRKPSVGSPTSPTPVVTTVPGGTTQTLAQNQTTPEQATPTSLPTESPAPSPSPSDVPTAKPTITPMPTDKPTASPTESPAPSPSPSSIPTVAPTESPSNAPSQAPTTSPAPTQAPSTAPSTAPSSTPTDVPSAHPTVSVQPSFRPSRSPSDQPSNTPTVSLAPSALPSLAPSISQRPSQAPSYISAQQAIVNVTLDLNALLTNAQIEALEAATIVYMEQEAVPGGYLEQATVNVIAQQTRQPTPFGRSRRALQEYTVLELALDVAATYTGSAVDFDLGLYMASRLDPPNPVWIHLLGNEDTIFLPLRPPTPVGTRNVTTSREESAETPSGMTKGTYAVVILTALAALALGAVSSVYAVRQHRLETLGTELKSPRMVANATTWNTADSNEWHQSCTLAEQEESGENYEEKVEEDQVSTSASCQVLPLGLDSLCATDTVDHESYSRATSTVPSPMEKAQASVFRHTDPPVRRMSPRESSEIDFGRNRALLDQDDSLLSGSYGDSRISARPPPPHQTTGRYPGAAAHFPHFQPQRTHHADLDQEILLTKSVGGTLGAKAVDDDKASASDFSSQAKFYLSRLLGTNTASGPLSQASSRDHGTTIQKTVSYDSVLRRPGLYDVFAPPGPIGIVVDTTKDGPAVHALKTTSPMLGLIQPGDLIVGLDDQDTRSMTAATLTRLMAAKAQEHERKITLLTNEHVQTAYPLY